MTQSTDNNSKALKKHINYIFNSVAALKQGFVRMSITYLSIPHLNTDFCCKMNQLKSLLVKKKEN